MSFHPVRRVTSAFACASCVWSLGALHPAAIHKRQSEARIPPVVVARGPHVLDIHHCPTAIRIPTAAEHVRHARASTTLTHLGSLAPNRDRSNESPRSGELEQLWGLSALSLTNASLLRSPQPVGPCLAYFRLDGVHMSRRSCTRLPPGGFSTSFSSTWHTWVCRWGMAS